MGRGGIDVDAIARLVTAPPQQGIAENSPGGCHTRETTKIISSMTVLLLVTCLEFASRIGFDRKVSCLTYFYLTRFPTAKSEFQNRFETRSRYSHSKWSYIFDN